MAAFLRIKWQQSPEYAARQKHMHLTMECLVRMGSICLTMRTLALMGNGLGHDVLPGNQFRLCQRIVYVLIMPRYGMYLKTGSYFLTAP
jgi:hypothetical protein